MAQFELKEEHLKLLRRANIYWDAGETGAPAIDPKRPYGNSGVTRDVLEILDVAPESRCRNCGGEFSIEQDADAAKLHRETLQALQILVGVGTVPLGTYTYTAAGWRIVGGDQA